MITRHRKTVAALVAATSLKDLERLKAAGPAAGLASLVGGWKGSHELVKTVLQTRRSKPRLFPGRRG
jgi:hypothetical protein